MPLPLLAKSRAFDYFEKRGLEKVTDVNAGDWHLYILKELIDNALDADEAAGLPPQIDIEFHYRPSGRLVVSLANAAEFPLDEAASIFSFDSYSSVKDFFNSLTRGQQGNGLKTVLGIPYALKHFSQGHYALDFNPLSIQVWDRKCAIACDVDEERQTAHVKVSERRSQSDVAGTRINVCVANFAPQPPPSIDEVTRLARQYALFNPFARFSWTLSFADGAESVALEFPARVQPRRLAAPPPVRWYRFDQFARLCRRLTLDDGSDLPGLLAWFLHLDAPDRQRRVLAELAALGVRSVGDLGQEAKLRAAYDVLVQATPQISLDWLGELGPRAIDEFARGNLKLEGELCYRCHKECPPQDPAAPFALEVFMLRSPQLRERTLWMGVNFTPLYKDPFYRKRFRLQGGSPTEVMGLNRVLQALGVEQDDNVLVGVHLISPNIEFQSFGKAEFDCRLIEAPLLELIERVSQEFQRLNRIKSHERLMLPLIGEAAKIVSSDGKFRFTMEQLYRRTRHIVRQRNPAFPAEPRSDDAERFRTIVLPEHEKSHGPIDGLVRSRKSKFLQPSRPIGAVLWIMKPGFEDVFINNDLMNMLEVALFWGDIAGEEMWSELSGHLHKNKSYTILALHDADVPALIAVRQAADGFAKANPPGCRFVDLGLTASQALELGVPGEAVDRSAAEDAESIEESLAPGDAEQLLAHRLRFDLNALSADELIQWILGRYIEIGIIEDRKLSREDMRAQLASYLLRLARARIEQRVTQELKVAATVDRITQALSRSLVRQDQALLDKLITSPPKTWKTVLDAFADDFVNSHLNRADISSYSPE
jgi:hypothetical protein